jgi:PAS domain S-box-containing protein
VKTVLRVLVVEDSEFDAQVMVSLLRKGGYEVTSERVETKAALQQALAGQTWDVVLADYNLPEFNALGALETVQESGLDLPFIIVSGGIGEDIAVAAMKAGAHDYLMKGNLNRLVPAVERELREAAIRASKRVAEQALQESELRYRTLWNASPDAVIVIDTASTILYVNPAVQQVFGYSSDELVKQSLAMLQPPHLRGLHQPAMDRYLRTGVKKLNWRATEMTGLRKDGAQIPIEVSFTDMELNGKRFFVGFIRDITERKRAERELREHEEQFLVARDIQQRLFPKGPPVLPGFEVAGASHPAALTGGDYYDYLPMLHGRLGVVLGDVTGHGVGPAMIMAEARAYLRILASRREDPGEILTLANHVIAEDMGDRFVTLLLARLDPRSRTLVYSSAGHPAAYVLAAAGTIKARLPRTGMALGLQPDTLYPTSPEIPLLPGDLLLFITDGIEESSPDETQLFGADRVLEVVREHRHQPAQQIVNAMYQAARAFSRGTPQQDDLTAVVIKVLPEG